MTDRKDGGPAHLENWSMIVRGTIDPYTAPETIAQSLHGIVSAHTRIADGTEVTTSRITEIDFKACTARTKNTEYTLGEPDPKWIQWCEDNDVEHDVLKVREESTHDRS